MQVSAGAVEELWVVAELMTVETALSFVRLVAHMTHKRSFPGVLPYVALQRCWSCCNNPAVLAGPVAQLSGVNTHVASWCTWQGKS